MKNVAYLAAALMMSTCLMAQAAEVTVIKDTRQYQPYTNSTSGIDGCTMPSDPDHPNLDDPNECRVTRGKMTVAGELLLRNAETGLCSSTVYSATRAKPNTLALPELSQREEVFKCNASGKRMGPNQLGASTG